MTTHVINSDADLMRFTQLLKCRKLPVTVEVRNGRHRSVEQNKLQRLWMREISEQTGMGIEEARAYCKLTIGVPILREEDDLFRERYDSIIKPLEYPEKMMLMAEPLDMPVTRLMTVDQKSRYLDEINRHFAEQGVALTQP